jgi:hypothetical protein
LQPDPTATTVATAPRPPCHARPPAAARQDLSKPANHPSLRQSAIAVALVGCQAPFGVDRHDLVEDRIAAITRDATDGARVHAWTVTSGHLWDDGEVEVSWYDAPCCALSSNEIITATDAALAGDAALVGLGRAPVITARAAVVVARFPSGLTRTAFVELNQPGASFTARIDAGMLNALSFTEAGPEQLEVEARSALTAETADTLSAGAWARLALTVEPEAAPARTRWMSTRAELTFLELDDARTDLATGEVLLDDLEIESSSPAADGPVTVLALYFMTGALPDAVARELWIGEPPANGMWTSRSRWLPLGGALDVAANSTIAGTLVADDTSPVGVRLDNPRVAVDGDVNEAAAACLRAEDFDPTWLSDGSCTRAQIDGLSVTVRAR